MDDTADARDRRALRAHDRGGDPQTHETDSEAPFLLHVEEVIQEAIERGLFDNLPGTGRPLDLSDEDNPFIPDDMRLAYRILRNAGFAPPWIEARHDIEAASERLRSDLARHAARIQAGVARLSRAPAYLRPTRRAALRREHDRFVQRYRASIEELNRRIDDFNLGVPISSLQLPRINLRHTLEMLDSLLPTDL
jgi:DnaJ family protein C protein 28